jgi:hypothetical protein
MQTPMNGYQLTALMLDAKAKYADLEALCKRAAPYPGFFGCALLATGIIATGLRVQFGALGWSALLLALLLVGATVVGQRTRSVMIAVGLSLTGLIATALAKYGVFGTAIETIPAVVGAAFIVTQFAMLCAFRLRPTYYIGFALLVAWVVLHVSKSGGYAAWAFVLTGAALACCNYIVQFVLDHFDEFQGILKGLDKATFNTAVKRVAYLWIPVLLLAWGGMNLNAGIQDAIKRGVYKEPEVLRLTSEEAKNYRNRSLRSDVLTVIAASKVETHDSTHREMQELLEDSSVALSELPEKTGDVIEKARPRHFSQVPCNSANFRFEIWGPDIRLPLGPLCRRIIESIDAGAQRSFNKARTQATEAVRVQVAKASNKSEVAAQELLTISDEAVKRTYAGVEATVRSLFGLLIILEVVSVVVLLGSLVGALAMVLGRVLFDARAQATKKLNTFSLGHGAAHELEFTTRDEVRLNDASLPGSDQGWWIYTLASRHGEGTHLIPRVPQPLRSIVQRFFSNRLLMTSVDTQIDDVRGADLAHSPTISSPGDLQFVCVSVAPGQAITFKMGDLFGFTANVRLRSVYTTHVGANLLGLGTFYSVAYVGDEDTALGRDDGGQQRPRPTGTIILCSEGNRIEAASAKQQVSARGLLAWDRRTRFTVKQELGMIGVWLVPPHVQIQNQGSAIYDEANESRAPILQNLWRMLRYLCLPF